MSQIKIAKKEVLWNYIGTFFNMGSNYLQLPFLLQFLDADVLGLWYVLMSLSAISNLITFGFTPSFSRSVAYCWSGAQQLKKEGKVAKEESSGERDYTLLAQVISTCKLIYFVMACVATFILASIGTLYINFIASDIMSTNIIVGWIIFLLAIFINLYYGYNNAILVGVGGIKENNEAITVSNIIRVVLLAVLLFLGLDFTGACITFLAYGFILRFMCKRSFEKRTSLSKIIKQEKIVTTKEAIIDCFKTLWPNAWRDGMVSVSDYVSTQAGTLLCSTFLTLEQTATYSIISQVTVAVAKIARSVDNAHLPVIQSAYINNDKDKIKKTQSMCVSAYVLVFVIGSIGMAVVGLPVIHIFKTDMEIDLLLFLGLSIYQFMISFRNCYAAYMSSTNRLWYWKSYIVASAICLGLQIVLFMNTDFGVWVIVFSSIISELVYNIWHWPMFVNKELELSMKDYTNGLMEFIKMFLSRSKKK